MLSANETSAHETSLLSVFNTNCLRFYSENGKRRRRASSTRQMRRQLSDELVQNFTDIRSIKIKDTGILFTARIKGHSGRTIHRTAYTLYSLARLLCGDLTAIPA